MTTFVVWREKEHDCEAIEVQADYFEYDTYSHVVRFYNEKNRIVAFMVNVTKIGSHEVNVEKEEKKCTIICQDKPEFDYYDRLPEDVQEMYAYLKEHGYELNKFRWEMNAFSQDEFEAELLKDDREVVLSGLRSNDWF